MSEWKKRGNCTSYEEYVMEQTGKSIEDFIDVNREYKIPGIALIAERLREAVRKGEKVCVISDYDADGVTSTVSMTMILRALKLPFSLVVPRRISEGYGLGEKACNRALETDADIYLTIDNGITAVEQIRRLKSLGKTVIVMDHHQKQEEIPEADIIVDPEAFPTSADYDGYCGAGLAYKLAEALFPDDERFLSAISIYSAIGTICDVVPLREDNRRIVMKGMESILNPEIITHGTFGLIKKSIKTEIQYMSSSDIAYYVGPCINAPGRLQDNGAEISITTMASGGEKAGLMVEEMIRMNNERIDLTKEAIDNFNSELFVDSNYILYLATGMPEGLLGVLAGRLCEEYKKPAIVITEGDGDFYKGSCRSIDEVDLVATLENCKDMFLSFGGHKLAAGLTFKRDDLPLIRRRFDEVFPKVEVDDAIYYDFEINNKTSDLEEFLRTSDKLEPFGEGNREPVVLIKNIKIGKLFGTNFEKCKYIGEGKEHLSITTEQGYKMVCFHMGKELSPDVVNRWTHVDVIGRVKRNWYKGNAYRQVIVEQIRKAAS